LKKKWDDVGSFPQGTRRWKWGDQSQPSPSTLSRIIAHFILFLCAFWDGDQAIFYRKHGTRVKATGNPKSIQARSARIRHLCFIGGLNRNHLS
jgi:hypothetical protein